MAKKSRRSWKNKARITKKDDNLMVGGLSTDIVIPVMGPTGVGKSTFINTLLGNDNMLVGHGVFSCTSKIQYAIIDNPSPRIKGHRVIIVDTPGFDDTYEDDSEILRRIAVWLASSYDADMKLGGVIYLLSITEKMRGTTRRNLDMFNQLCGDKALSNVFLGTTKWGEVDENVGKKREQELAENFFNGMTASGSKVLRFYRTEEAAQSFLDAILGQLQFGRNEEILNDNVLRIQSEIVDRDWRIPETAAGKELSYTLEQLREFGILKDEADFEKARTLSANIEKQKKNGPKMMKRPPVMILLMGEVGAGKSTFINTAAGKPLAIVGEEGDICPCTLTVKYFVIQHPKCEVVLVDTPGFNNSDPTKGDGVILKGIVDWMKKCPKNIPFGGIIFLHDLSEKRQPLGGVGKMTPTKLSDYESHRVVLAMVNGDGDAAELRENHLKSSIWPEVQTCRFMNTQESAWSILNTILDVDPIKLQDIQDELERICTTQFAQRQNRSFLSRFFGSLFSPR